MSRVLFEAITSTKMTGLGDSLEIEVEETNLYDRFVCAVSVNRQMPGHIHADMQIVKNGDL